ncbi:MAG: methyltransferase domain-containing protein, partial [Chloroflexi bacterium]|nr:methyltransferase domain-containing protein [Chloroflexota bacterium]
MTDQGARYDRIAEGYAQWWSPVHRPATLALLDEIEAPVAAGATRILDVGCGTGALVSAVVTRWPHVSVTGVDLSPGMLAVAERELDVV